MMTVLMLGAWTLGSAAMLTWAAAIAIPLAIHFWSRRRHREYAWAAMQFLLAAMKKHSRRLRIEQLVLLAVRMLLLGILALALADPIWSWSTDGGGPLRRGTTHFVFVIDTSFSMSLRDRDQTLLQLAQEQIRELIKQSDEGDGFSLVLMEEKPRSVLSDIAFDHAEFLRQVDRLQVSHGGADLSATLSVIEESLNRSRKEHSQLDEHRIYIFSDLGLNTWSEVALPSVLETLERLSKDSELFLKDVGLDEQSNLAITSLSGTQSVVTPGERIRFTAELAPFGLKQSITAQVEFLVGSRVVHAEDVRVVPGTTQNTSWEHTFDAAGDQTISARVAADSLSLDNDRWLIVPVRESLSVLCVGGEPEAAEFVALALNPDSREDALVQVTLARESAILEQNLSEFDCIFVCNVGRFTSFEAAALQRYVSQGGGLVISLGDQIQEENYNRQLGNEETRLLPATLSGLERGEYFFDPLEYRHRVIAPFRGRERAGLLTVPTWRYFRLVPVDSATVALGLTSGHPAIVESNIGLGRSILVATALSPSSFDRSSNPPTPWTALPAWPSFPPLVHGLLQLATQGREGARTVAVGSPLNVPLRPSDHDIFVVKPDQQRQRLSVDESDGQKRAVFADTSRCGVYQVEIQSEPLQRRMYAANLDSRESDIRRLKHASLPEVLRSVEQIGSATSFVFSPGRQQPLFRPMLVLVAFFLLVEQLLAVSFARRSL